MATSETPTRTIYASWDGFTPMTVQTLRDSGAEVTLRFSDVVVIRTNSLSQTMGMLIDAGIPKAGPRRLDI